jgi:hypothetical protein
LQLTYYHPGEKWRGASSGAVSRLSAWLERWPPGVHGDPRDRECLSSVCGSTGAVDRCARLEKTRSDSSVCRRRSRPRLRRNCVTKL